MKIILSNTSSIHVIWSFFRVTSVAVEIKKSNAYSESVFLIHYPVQFFSFVGYFTYITSCVFDCIFSFNHFLAIVRRQVCRPVIFTCTLRRVNNT
jgi:hypothetical protein